MLYLAFFQMLFLSSTILFSRLFLLDCVQSDNVGDSNSDLASMQTDKLAFFEPLPHTLVTAPCSWIVKLNVDKNRIPGKLINEIESIKKKH